MLFSSLLVITATQYEVLFSAIVETYFNSRPEALKRDESKFTFAELASYESVEAFREYYVQQHIDKVLWKGFDDWLSWLNERMKIPEDDVTLDVDKTKEIFQRRHLHVHTGGVVSRQYIEKVGERADVSVGDRLPVTQDYLRDAVDRITICGILSAVEVASKLKLRFDEDDRYDFASLASTLIYDELARGNFNVVKHAAAKLRERAASDYSKGTLLVNEWVARKELHGLENVKKEVEGWQTSHLSDEFKLARLALLNENEEALQLANRLVREEKLSEQNMRTWPLLRGVRVFETLQQGRPGAAEDDSSTSDQDFME